MAPEITEESTLRWAPDVPRTRIPDRRGNLHWRLPLEQYRAGLTNGLVKMGALRILITHSASERTDPGVAVWWSTKKEVFDYSWQSGLNLNNPAPTLEEIDQAFRLRAQKCHPDRADGGDSEMFRRLGDYRREARAWVLGTHESHEFVLPCDHFDQIRLNMAALKFACEAFRKLDAVGIPGILERTLSKTFSALPAPPSVVTLDPKEEL